MEFYSTKDINIGEGFRQLSPNHFPFRNGGCCYKMCSWGVLSCFIGDLEISFLLQACTMLGT